MHLIPPQIEENDLDNKIKSHHATQTIKLSPKVEEDFHQWEDENTNE